MHYVIRIFNKLVLSGFEITHITRYVLEKEMYFNAIVVYSTFKIIIDGRIRIQIKLRPDIFLEILQINKYNRGGDNCNRNIAVGQ